MFVLSGHKCHAPGGCCDGGMARLPAPAVRRFRWSEQGAAWRPGRPVALPGVVSMCQCWVCILCAVCPAVPSEPLALNTARAAWRTRRGDCLRRKSPGPQWLSPGLAVVVSGGSHPVRSGCLPTSRGRRHGARSGCLPTSRGPQAQWLFLEVTAPAVVVSGCRDATAVVSDVAAETLSADHCDMYIYYYAFQTMWRILSRNVYIFLKCLYIIQRVLNQVDEYKLALKYGIAHIGSTHGLKCMVCRSMCCSFSM